MIVAVGAGVTAGLGVAAWLFGEHGVEVASWLAGVASLVAAIAAIVLALPSQSSPPPAAASPGPGINVDGENSGIISTGDNAQITQRQK